MISQLNRLNRQKSELILVQHSDQLAVLGIALCGIWQSATCYRKCFGLDHVIESLGCRVYNLACASYALISIGFYDESLGLTRSIGEIANLLSLSHCNPTKFQEWINSSEVDRLKTFRPAQIRQLIENSDGVVLMDKNWYSKLCETSTHVTPTTSPNNYDHNRNVCGGLTQKEGMETALGQLIEVVSMISLYLCKYSGLDDLFEQLASEAGRKPEGN